MIILLCPALQCIAGDEQSDAAEKTDAGCVARPVFGPDVGIRRSYPPREVIPLCSCETQVRAILF